MRGIRFIPILSSSTELHPRRPPKHQITYSNYQYYSHITNKHKKFLTFHLFEPFIDIFAFSPPMFFHTMQFGHAQAQCSLKLNVWRRWTRKKDEWDVATISNGAMVQWMNCEGRNTKRMNKNDTASRLRRWRRWRTFKYFPIFQLGAYWYFSVAYGGAGRVYWGA